MRRDGAGKEEAAAAGTLRNGACQPMVPGGQGRMQAGLGSGGGKGRGRGLEEDGRGRA